MSLNTQETAEVLAGFDMAMVAALPEKPATDAPPANSLIRLIASAYGVDDETAVPPAQRAALALGSSKTEKDLLAMIAKHSGITEIKDKAGREQAHGAAMEMMRARTTIKKVADAARDDAKKFNAAVLAEEKRLTAIVEPEETRLKVLRDAWDTEQERIKAEKAEAERQRLIKIADRIQEIKSYASLATQCRTAERVQGLIDKLAAYDLSGFDEFDAEAAQAHADTIKAMGDQFRLLTEREAEAARLKAEREELARQQAEAQRQAEELAAQQKAEADRLAAERAELERMRAEIAAAAAKASAPALEQAMSDAATGGTGVLMASPSGMARVDPAELTLATAPPCHQTVVMPPDADLVDTATCDIGAAITDDSDVVDAEIRLGFDMAMSMPVATSAPASDTPPAASLIKCIAQAYGVDDETAVQWLCARADDFDAWVPAA